MTLVTHPDWSVSSTTGTHYDGAILHVHKRRGDPRKIRRGDAYGRVFESTAAANAYALEHGYLQRYYRNTVGRCACCGAVHGAFYYDRDGDGSHFRVDPQGFRLMH